LIQFAHVGTNIHEASRQKHPACFPRSALFGTGDERFIFFRQCCHSILRDYHSVSLGLPLHPFQKLYAGNALEAGMVVAIRYLRGATVPGIHDEHRPPVTGKVKRRREAARSSADDETVDRSLRARRRL
jgi:hypothetical protein